jgi:outer membrane biosynthesis protein TonB
MNRTTMSWAGRTSAALVLALLLLTALLLSGCGDTATATPEATAMALEPTSAPTEPPAPTSAPTEPPAPTTTPTQLSPTDTPAPTDTPLPTDTPTPEPVDDTACLSCHTDQETLQAVAEEPEEEGESLSEGEG